MCRPHLFIGIIALIASAISLLGSAFCVAALLILAAIILFVLTLKRQGKPLNGVVLAVVCLLLAVRLCGLVFYVENKTEALNGRTANVTARVVKALNFSENYSRYTLKINDSSFSSAKNITVTATMNTASNLSPGDKIEAVVSFNKLQNKYKASNLSNGNYFSCSVLKYQKVGTSNLSVFGFAENVRNSIKTAISKGGSGESSALMCAVILGDTSNISDSLNTNVKNAGVSHMLVVSGMHLGTLCGVLFLILERTANRKVFVFCGLIMVIFMAVICLFHVSILRAAIAYIIMLLSRLALRNFDSLNSLGLGVVLVILIFPFSFYNAAFLLSVFATFAVICPADMLIKAVSFKRCGKFLGAALGYVYGVFAVSLSALICTLPITVYYFGYSALIAPVTNLAVGFIITLVLVFGVFAVILSFMPVIGEFLSLPFFALAKMAANLFITAVDFIGSTKLGVVNINSSENIYCFFVAVLFILLVKIFYNYKMKRKERAIRAYRKNIKISP